jgi:hypothetical protein
LGRIKSCSRPGYLSNAKLCHLPKMSLKKTMFYLKSSRAFVPANISQTIIQETYFGLSGYILNFIYFRFADFFILINPGRPV